MIIIRTTVLVGYTKEARKEFEKNNAFVRVLKAGKDLYDNLFSIKVIVVEK